jgi:hypothetical protein
MRKRAVFVFFGLLILLSCITGCTYTNPSGTPVTPPPSPSITVTQPAVVPMTVITAVPATELARIRQDSLGIASGTGSIYQFRGSLAISGGAYKSVKAILQYPDGTAYVFDAGNMGGASPVVKTMILYPDSRYQGQTPKYLISLDGKEYSTVYQYTDGTIYRIASTDTVVPVS